MEQPGLPHQQQPTSPMLVLSSESLEHSRLQRQSQLESDGEEEEAHAMASLMRSPGPVLSPPAARTPALHAFDGADEAVFADEADDPVAAAGARASHTHAREAAGGVSSLHRNGSASPGHSKRLQPAAEPSPGLASEQGSPPEASANGSASQPSNGRLPPPSPKPWHHGATAMHDANDAETAQVCAMLREAIAMRQRYMGHSQPHARPAPVAPSPIPHFDPFAFPASGPPPRSAHVFEMRRGVMVVWRGSDLPSLLQEYEAAHKVGTDFHRFTLDMGRMHELCAFGPVYSFCVRRLALLESRYRLHTMEHEGAELQQMRANPHRDYYNCRKVDTHIHLAAAMNQKHLLRFIKRKMKVEADEPVIAKGGRTLTLREVCDELRLSPYDINLDSLGMHAESSAFRRFDKFNLKYNPLGDASLREIFIKTDNYMQGRYLAELTKELFADLEESKYVNTEYRLSIYGRKRDEWSRLADWVVQNRLWSPNNRWLVQVPRLFHLYRQAGSVESFEDFLANIFAPLFEVTRDPASCPRLHLFLQQLVGFDCVDDESKPDGAMPMSEPDWARGGYPREPREWTSADNPHYAYYVYFLYANLNVLNRMRSERGFNTFHFRPHSGEAGELSHLHSTFLCAHAINHGLMLRRSPPLQYLHYLTQIGIAMSPLSNNMLFCELAKSPFPLYFVRGLNVCLSTDDPLMFHYTKEPLMEEYCIARHTWQLSPVDLSESFRLSVLHSSFEPCVKAHWLGPDYALPGAAGNDITRTNVPDLRLAFREGAHREELRVVFEGAAGAKGASGLLAGLRPGEAGPGGPRQSQRPHAPSGTASAYAAISLESFQLAHDASQAQGGRRASDGGGWREPPPPELVAPNAQGRRASAADAITAPLRAAQALLTARAQEERRLQDEERQEEPRVLGLSLSAAVALGVGACAVAASAFALGAAVTGVFALRRGRDRRRGV